MIDEEIDIIRQLKSGNERAYRYLFDKHYVLLCKIAAEYVHDDFTAETIVGNVIVSIWEKRNSIEINTSLRAYLVQAVRNRCLNYLDLKHVRKEVRLNEGNDAVGGIDFFAITDESYPLGILLEKELEGEIAQAINRLPEECQHVFRMSRLEQLKNQDIAKKLNISISTVKYHLRNALKRLSDDLHKYMNISSLLLIFELYFLSK